MKSNPKLTVECPICHKLSNSRAKYFFRCCHIAHDIKASIRAKSYLLENIPKKAFEEIRPDDRLVEIIPDEPDNDNNFVEVVKDEPNNGKRINRIAEKSERI